MSYDKSTQYFSSAENEHMSAEELISQPKAVSEVNKENNPLSDLILYHGSKGGIEGKIRPISREKCDFGKGFYMGEKPDQVISLVVEYPRPVFYELNFKLSEIPRDRILILKDGDWVNAILASRGQCSEFNELKIAKYWLNKLNRYDVVIGEIADDRMKVAMKRFTENGLTDEGLKACLQFVNYGKQYVAKTDFACSKIEIKQHRVIMNEEVDNARSYYSKKMVECQNVVNRVATDYLRKGLYLAELIQREKLREK